MANEKFNEAESDARLAASRANPLIDFSNARGTMENCAKVTEFVGTAADSIDHNGGSDYGEAVFLLMECVSSALKYEAERGERKPSAAEGAQDGALQ